MRWRLFYFLLSIALTLFANDVFALPPTIGYSPSTNIYTVGTAITTLTPTIGNGVSAMGFGTATALTGATLNNPRGVAIDAAGNIYVTNSGNNTISKYNSSGTYLGTFGTGATMSFPKDLVFDSSGNAYVLNLGATPGTGSVYKYNSSGVYQSTILSGLNYALGITIDKSDNIYLADQGAGSVTKYNTSGTLLLSLPTANFNVPLGVAVDAAGSIYVLNNGSGNVTKYNSAGTFQSTFLSGYTSAQAITIDNAGNFYIGDNAATNTIYVYNQSGTLLTSKATTDPEGIAVDSKGVIFTSAYYANQMNKYTPTGGFFLSAALPAGLSFNSTTGAISGTPTAAMATTTYTVTAYNASGAGTGTVTITVNPTTPTGTGGSTCGAGTVTLTASGSTPSGGVYNWYAALTGGSSLGTGASFITPTITATTTYYVSYTQNGATSTPRIAVTATVNAKPVISTAPTSPTASLYLSYPFTGNANDASGNLNNGIPQNAPTLTTDRYGAASSAYSFNGSTQYIATSIPIITNPQTFSISVWFKTSSAGGKLVGFGSAQFGTSTSLLGYDRHIYMNNSGQLYFGVKPGSTYNTINTTASYADGTWHHAVVTMSSTNGASMYVDGALQASDATMTSAGAYAGYWRVAYDNLASWTSAPTNYFFSGSLDDIAVYNTELTAAQVYTLYGAGSTPICPGSTLSLQANTVSGATYSWTGPNSFTSTSQNPTIANATTANAGTYILTVTGSNGCTSQLNVTGTVNALPSTAFTATSSVNINSNATITYTGTDPSTSTYNWDFNGGTPSTGTGQGPFSVQWATSGTKTITLTVTNAAGCSSSSTQNVTVNLGTYGNYAFGESITLNTTSLGITSNLTNFPALLSIQDNNLIISNTCTDKVQNPNGPNYDFAFVSGGSELYYQVESYDQTTGTLLVWVQIPTLTYATNNTVTFYYGSKSPTVTHNTAFFANTWASNYLAVFHFNESSFTGSVTDGTAGGHTGATSGMAAADLVTGKIGTAYSFNGSSKKITTNAVSVTGPFTISAWVKLGATGLDQKVMTNQGASGGTSGGYKLGIYTTNIPESESGIAMNRSSTPNPAAFASGAWHYIQSVYTGTTLSTYVDGAQYKILTTSNNPSANANFYIGVGEGGSQLYFNGIIDEPRVSNVAKTADWLKAEYVNQNNPVTFTTVGATVTNTTNAAAIPGALTYTYKGVTGTYTDASNWDNTTAGITNQAPAFDGTATLIIPTGKSITINSNASVYGLTLSGTASVSLSANLSVGCNIYNQGTGKIDWNNLNTSKITWNGTSAAQSYNGAASAGYTHVGTMEINNSAGGTITVNSDTLDIYNELKITKGNLAVASGAIMVLKSGVSQTASVDAIPTGYSITGTIYAERYFKAGTIAANTRNYRLLSSPVNTATGAYNLGYLNTNSGGFTGVFVAGPTGPAGGFTVTNATSTAYLYKEDLPASNTAFNSGNFKGLTNIAGNTISYYTGTGSTTATTTLPVGNGYMLYYAGNNINNVTSSTALNKQYRFGGSYIDPDASTMVAVGTLNQGSIPVKLWWNSGSSTLSKAQTGYNLVGNPYASSIDWDTFSQSSSTNGIYGPGVSATIYVYNYSNKNYGTYTALIPGGIGTNNATRYIASGQGFFVQATTTSASLTFNETAKTTVQPNSLGSTLYLLMSKKGQAVAKPQLMRIKLAADSVNTDEIIVLFDSEAKNEYEPFYDSDRLNGIGNISTLASYGYGSKNMLAINRMNVIDSTTRIKLFVNVNNSAATDTISGSGFDSLDSRYDVYLLDHYKKDSLFFSRYKRYLFNIDKTDTTSYGANRFEIVFHKKSSLNYRLLGFQASPVKDGILLTWKTENEGNLCGFTLQRQDGSKEFIALTSLVSNGSGSYTYIDKFPLTGTNYYRLQQNDPFNVIRYSKTIAVGFNAPGIVNEAITLYPNPVNNEFYIKINKNAPDRVILRVTGIAGQIMFYREMDGNNIQQNVSSLLPGNYIVEISDKVTKKLIGIKKFNKE
ncbi:DUF2341 domain-containing protein [Mucilaginibacter pocheonensis]|uniref:Staphylococcus aureus surface protein A n=1 Tax=Mucilaginibacter pocheonensis TaxID=398050 RepID=A0ABU1TH66_9SPHI|nr:DUF2341 domain-containing protein [Mucilaginibacter pocheonensis]MDR6944763.1 hypothetical protein [Mucilaginibacter pocheonensis]